MTDHELLELAAKAVGIYHEEIYFPGKGLRMGESGNGYTNWIVWWNPLDDDGDALRLVVALKLSVTQMPSEAGYCPCIFVSDEKCRDLAWEEIEEEIERQSAIRHAIVRAAAEIGKNMK